MNDYIHIINSKKGEFSDAKFKELQTKTMKDSILSKIFECYKFNWPGDKTELPKLDELRYFNPTEMK